MPSEQSILLLGIEGSGKTTYLYRLVTSYLETKGLRRAEIDGLEADEFLSEARRRGVTWAPNSATEAFLGQAHEAMRDDRDIKLDVSEEAVPLAIGFSEFDYSIKTAEVPGSLVARTAHLLERGEIDKGDDQVKAYYRYLCQTLRKADGVLFLHPPHELGREVESEIVLRAFGDLALRINRNPFVPVVVVFTKAEQWAPQEVSTNQTRAVVLTSTPVMSKRDRFIEAYWQVLTSHHGSQLDHPFWRGITDPYRTGQNFAMVAANKDKFADLRAPLDVVVRLNSLKRGFYAGLRRRNVVLATVGLFVFVLGVLLSLYLPMLFGPQDETRVPDFPDAQSVYAWLQESPSSVELEVALNQIDSNLQVIEPQLRGATGEFTQATFNRYRDFLATVGTFRVRAEALGAQGTTALERAAAIEQRVLDTLQGWLEQHKGGAERAEEYEFRWVAAVERYVDGLEPYLRRADPSRFDGWRSDWLAKQFHDLQEALAEVREQRRSAVAYAEAARRQLDLAWRYLVEGRSPHGESLAYLPLHGTEAQLESLRAARRFIVLLQEGGLEVELHVSRYAVSGGMRGRLNPELRLDVVGGDVSMRLRDTHSQSGAPTPEPRVFEPIRESPLVFIWNIRQPASLHVIDPTPAGDSFRYRLDFEQAVSEFLRDELPLPGFLPAALDEEREYGDRGDADDFRKLRFRLVHPPIPPLLLTSRSQVDQG